MKKILFLLPLLVLILVQPVFAQSTQSASTEKGTLNVELTLEPSSPSAGDEAKLDINFINPMTKKTQEHIDYQVEVTKGDTIVFKTDTLLHTAIGTIKIPVQFPEDGTYLVKITVEGILFSPIPAETVTFDIPIGKSSEPTPIPKPAEKGGGCLIATAAYGSELSPQIQELREVRDNVVMKTESGKAFMTAFNQFYYSFSPSVADFERDNSYFREIVKFSLTPLLSSLSILNHVNIDSEQDMIAYGIGIISMNLGLYIGLPIFATFALIRLRK